MSPSPSSIIQPTLLSKMNEQQVFRAIQRRGPMSRAEVARFSGISAPTASRAVEALLRAGFIEEGATSEMTSGRPAKKLRPACETAQVLGVVIDAAQCRMVTAGLDGRLHENQMCSFSTPSSYDAIIETVVDRSRKNFQNSKMSTLGMAVSMPGLLDYRSRKSILSPNLPLMNNHSPVDDLTNILGVDCIMVQETHGLCLAERHYGNAIDLDDFAMLDITTGIGLGVMSGGKILSGHSGLAGEIGHITVDPDGRLCGCGNRGCLETVASDSALAWAVSHRIGRRVDIDEVITLCKSGETFPDEFERTCRYLAIGLAAVINLFNPSNLFIHGTMFQADTSLFPMLVEETKRRTLSPSYRDCRIIQAQGSKRLGAIAAIIEHLTNSIVPPRPSGPQ